MPATKAFPGERQSGSRKESEAATKLLNELTQFAETMDRVARQGYQPVEDWIGDGVIVRLVTLWQLIPIWYREPKKSWQQFQAGEYDSIHIALRHRPERGREQCKISKSFAIAD